MLKVKEKKNWVVLLKEECKYTIDFTCGSSVRPLEPSPWESSVLTSSNLCLLERSLWLSTFSLLWSTLVSSEDVPSPGTSVVFSVLSHSPKMASFPVFSSCCSSSEMAFRFWNGHYFPWDTSNMTVSCLHQFYFFVFKLESLSSVFKVMLVWLSTSWSKTEFSWSLVQLVYF